MRVGIDYLPATTHFPGVGRYARELVRALARLDDSPALALFESGGRARTIGEPHLGLEGSVPDVRRHRVRLPRRLLEAWARATRSGADRWVGGVDLFHRIHATWPPVADAPQVQPVGELPERESDACRALGRSLAPFEHHLVFSAHAVDELAERYGFARERIHRVPIGSDQWRRALPEPPPRRTPPLVLVLGALQPRRRPRTVLAGFESAVASAPELREARLVYAGGDGPERGPLGRRFAWSRLGERVDWRPDFEESELPALVAGASALVHLTEGEESAVTPLEAFSFGTPVVATDLPAFAEVLGGEAELVANRAADKDPAELGRAIERAVASASDPEACARREALARRFTWEGNARATVGVWRGIVAG